MIPIHEIHMGKRIKEARKNQKISREALADLVAITEQYLGEIERGKRIPSLEVYVNLINALQISSDVCLKDNDCGSLQYIQNESLEILQMLQGLSPAQVHVVLSIVQDLIDYMQKEISP